MSILSVAMFCTGSGGSIYPPHYPVGREGGKKSVLLVYGRACAL